MTSLRSWFRRGRHRGTYRPRPRPLGPTSYILNVPGTLRQGSASILMYDGECIAIPSLWAMHRATPSSRSVHDVIADAKRVHYSIEDLFKMRDQTWDARGHASVAQW